MTKEIYKLRLINCTTGLVHTEQAVSDNARRARRNFIRRMYYHGYIEKGDKYSVKMWYVEQLTMEV